MTNLQAEEAPDLTEAAGAADVPAGAADASASCDIGSTEAR